MPTYVYRCPKCDWLDEVVKPMAECNTTEACRQCGTEMGRDFSAEVRTTNAPCDNGREIHSDSLCVHPDQVQEHRQKFPDVTLDRECRPVFTSVKQREKYLNARGVLKVSHNKEY